MEETFSREEIIRYAFYSKFATLSEFEKSSGFFQKKTFFKNEPKTFRQGCQNCILRVQLNVSNKNIYFRENQNFIIILGLWAKKFSDISAQLSNCILRAQANILGFLFLSKRECNWQTSVSKKRSL